MLDHDIHSILITRVNDEKSQAILKEFPQIIYDELSHICYIDEEKKEINKGKIVVVCAGTSDLPVAREAYLTAQFLGNEVELVSDVGVAGIHSFISSFRCYSRSECSCCLRRNGRGSCFCCWRSC